VYISPAISRRAEVSLIAGCYSPCYLGVYSHHLTRHRSLARVSALPLLQACLNYVFSSVGLVSSQISKRAQLTPQGGDDVVEVHGWHQGHSLATLLWS